MGQGSGLGVEREHLQTALLEVVDRVPHHATRPLTRFLKIFHGCLQRPQRLVDPLFLVIALLLIIITTTIPGLHHSIRDSLRVGARRLLAAADLLETGSKPNPILPNLIVSTLSYSSRIARRLLAAADRLEYAYLLSPRPQTATINRKPDTRPA